MNSTFDKDTPLENNKCSWQRRLEWVKWQLSVLENILNLYRHSCSYHHDYIHWDGKLGIHHMGTTRSALGKGD